MSFRPNRAFAITALLAVAAGVAPAAAQELAGQLLQPTQPAPIRAAPPSGFWRTPGEQVAETAIGSDYLILDHMDVQSGLGASQTWVQIAPVDPVTRTVDPNASGWVYFGETATSRSMNFAPGSIDQSQSMNFTPGSTVTTRSLAVTPEAAAPADTAPQQPIIILRPQGN